MIKRLPVCRQPLFWATPASGQSESPCAPAKDRRHFGRSITSRIAASSASSRASQSIGWTRKWSKSQRSIESAGSTPACGQTSFSSSPLRWTTSVPALGLMQSQSIPSIAGKRSVALHRDAESARRGALDQGAIELEHRLAAGDDDQPVLGRLAPQSHRHDRRASALANLPPPSPSVPTKSVSQKLHCAVARSCSRPTTGCSRRSAGRRRGCPIARPRPAGSGSIP